MVFSTAHFFIFFLQWLLARRILSRGAFTRDRSDGGSLAGLSQPSARAPGCRVTRRRAVYAGLVGTAPGDDEQSSPGAGAGGEVAETVVVGSRRYPQSPEPRAACRLAFSAALLFFYLLPFLARRLPSHGASRAIDRCQ